MASALSITNGNFQAQSSPNRDVAGWWDYAGPSLDIFAGPSVFVAPPFCINSTTVLQMGNGANENEDGGNHAYCYQSIGTYTGTPQMVEITLDWGSSSWTPSPLAQGGEMGLTVMILESDGTFEPNEWDGAAHDIYGFVKDDENPDRPITEIARSTVYRDFAPGESILDERFVLDISSATVGNELFLRINDVKVVNIPYANVDNIEMSTASVRNEAPEDGAIYVMTELTSAENDLVFIVADPNIVAVDVLFSSDPNLFPSSEIVTKRTVTQGQNTVTLETELAGDLEWSTEYTWKVLAYKSDGGGGYSLVFTGLPTSFTTIQEGPFLRDVTPNVLAVWPGEDAVFSLTDYIKTDTFQWYQEGVGALSNGTDFTGVDSNSLTVLDAQLADEGTFYCVGTETATGLTAQTLSSGQLTIKQLRSYYPFDTVDGSGYTPDVVGGKNAQLMGGASLASADPIGSYGSYLVLDNPRNLINPDNPGHTQYADIADDTVAHYPDITVSCWVKPTLLDLDYERYARIFDFGQDNDNYFYLTLLTNSNEASCVIALDGSERDADGDGEIGYGTQWLYVVLTIEDGGGKIYINGEYGGGGGLRNPSDIPKTLNYIGKAISTEATYPNFGGLIDELKIYNYALTAEEIAQEYMDVRTEVEFICNRDDYDLGDWDFDNNCQVDLSDFAEIAEKWLLDYFIYPQ